MQNIELNEGQEFFIGGQRYVVKDGVPVQEAKRGPLGGELVRFGDLKPHDLFFIQFKKIDKTDIYSTHIHFRSILDENDIVEVNVPQPQRGRVMTAGEAARLPDIVGKTVRLLGDYKIFKTEPNTKDPLLGTSGVYGDMWIYEEYMVEVLD